MGSKLRSRLALGAAVTALVAGSAVAMVPGATAAEPGVPTVTPIAPQAGKGHGVSTGQGVIDLDAIGYAESEFLMSGQATTYGQSGLWTDDGRWATTVAAEGTDYTTRLLVERPKDPARFNGTVIVEWMNVSFGVDIPVDLSQSYRYAAREGYAYVGVTAQRRGAQKLTELDPERYPGVDLPNDDISYDVLTQAARAVRTNPAIIGATPTTVLASGHSQSAGRLVTYINAVQPQADVFDGFLVHGRAGGAAKVAGGGAPLSAKIRTDLDVPVFVLQAETDVPLSSSARQNTPLVRTWEVAGTAHADQYGLDLYNPVNARDKGINGGAATHCDKPVNSMTFRYAQNAAYHHLNRWAQGGPPPPSAQQVDAWFGVLIQRDKDGNAIGGVRLPDLVAPVATYSPNNSGGNVLGACLLLGTTTPFTAARLKELYPDHASYVKRFTEAADVATRLGYLLPADRDEAVARAQAAQVP
ncbi:alpha/beta hydrolase domain-containing protein [Actinokineospora sp. G85]|uniref:alpha/beta hydrolase domain-containing protein n=1 Tax=Actinokineospora sp. G85 TaxID=3406626 RepID=UPI003C717A16